MLHTLLFKCYFRFDVVCGNLIGMPWQSRFIIIIISLQAERCGAFSSGLEMKRSPITSKKTQTKAIKTSAGRLFSHSEAVGPLKGNWITIVFKLEKWSSQGFKSFKVKSPNLLCFSKRIALCYWNSVVETKRLHGARARGLVRQKLNF